MTYAYVDSDLHNARKLLSFLGSFWGDTYQGVDQIVAYCADLGEAGYQASIDLSEVINAVGRHTVPVYHTEQWQVYYLLGSQKGIAPVSYGAPGAGSFGGSLVYGSSGGAPAYSWTCPVTTVDLIFNRIYEPSATLTRGVDFDITAGRLVFRADPFADPRFIAQPVIDDTGQEVDSQLALWLFRPAIDQEFIWTQFGYVMGIRLASSQDYKDLVNALLDAIVGCTAADQLLAALAAVTDCPLARGNEVVEDIAIVADELLVITDGWVYRYSTACTAVVAIGDQLTAGDALVDTVETHYLNHGTVPDWLDALSVGHNLLLASYLSDIIFSNTETPLVVELNVDGYTRVSWALGGFPADVTEFWDQVHSRGVSSGTTLAHLLDVRTSPVGEPTAASLPATINPLEFLAANYLRHNALLVRIRTGGFGPGALGLEQLRHLRRIIPPHELVLIVIEMPVVSDSVTVDQVAEALLSYSAAEPLYEVADPSLIGDGPATGSVVLGTCYARAGS
jgi:hypothetical protein